LEVLPLLWFIVVVYPLIPSGPYGTCEVLPSDTVGSGLPRTTYFNEYTAHNCPTVEINIHTKKIYILNLINYYPLYIPS
jgi:hypothetical protein